MKQRIAELQFPAGARERRQPVTDELMDQVTPRTQGNPYTAHEDYRVRGMDRMNNAHRMNQSTHHRIIR